MNILFTVQRYGPDIVGGAEYHCRLVAEHLSREHQVEIATTCAMDYLTWENSVDPGTEIIADIPVHRFPVAVTRSPDFDTLAHHVLYGHPNVREQKTYLDMHGPYCPELIKYLDTRTDVDRFILFSYRYWTTYQALKNVGDRSILVPTAEHDRAIYLDLYKKSFAQPAAVAFNSVEEKELIQRVTDNHVAPGEIVGVGLAPGCRADVDEIRKKYDLTHPYILYVGRIEQAKGCSELMKNYMHCFRSYPSVPNLVFVGKKVMNIPDHAGIRYLGVVPEDEKQALLAGALCLVMPSRFESLSMVVLEAWREKVPVLCNSRCEVLRGQCQRSNGGIYYENADEFSEGLHLMATRKDLREHLGRQGHAYYENNYLWPVILEKYNRLLGI